MSRRDQFVSALPSPHPLRPVFNTLNELGLSDSPMYARLEHVGDELRTLLHGLNVIANGHGEPIEVARHTLQQAALDRAGAA